MTERRLRHFLILCVPAFVILFAVHLQNSLGPLLHGRVPPDLGYAADASAWLQFCQIACIAWLMGVYAWALLSWRRGDMRARDVAPVIIGLTVLAWALLPANSSDILEYLGFGRLAGVYGLNPYTHTYSEITDAFSSYITWDDPMPYGPPMLPLFIGAGLLSVRHVLLGVYGLKFAWAALHLLNTWLVYRIARSLSADPAWAAFAFGCNPLILIELVGNGHNDPLPILCGLAAVLAVQRHRGVTALVVAFLGAIMKLAGIFWVAAVIALLVRRRAWRALWWGSAACAAAAIVLALWPGCLDALTVLNSQWHYSEDSLHTIVIDRAVTIWSHLSSAVDYDRVFDADRLIATPVFVGFLVWRLRQVRDVGTLVGESGIVFLALLLGYAVSVGPWYFTWLVPSAALADPPRVRRTIFVACASVTALYAFPFAAVETARRHEFWAAARLLIALGLPIAFGLGYPVWARAWQIARGPGGLAMPVAIAERP